MRRSAWLWIFAGLAGLAGAAILHVWIPGSDPRSSICFSRRLLAIPCPGCGLTRAFAHLAKGEWATALAVHPLAPVLAIELVFVWIVWGRAALRGLACPRPAWMERVAIAHLAVLCALWAGRLSTGSLPW